MKKVSALQMVKTVLECGEPMTLWEIRRRVIEQFKPAPEDTPCETSVSARIRDLRKDKFGGHLIPKERVPHKQFPVYRLVLPAGQQELFRRVA